MTSSGKVDAIQKAVMAAAKAAIAEYEKRNKRAASKDEPAHVNKPPRDFVEKVIRSRLEPGALVEAFVDDALEAVGQ